jgi:hypothetical protein
LPVGSGAHGPRKKPSQSVISLILRLLSLSRSLSLSIFLLSFALPRFPPLHPDNNIVQTCLHHSYSSPFLLPFYESLYKCSSFNISSAFGTQNPITSSLSLLLPVPSYSLLNKTFSVTTWYLPPNNTKPLIKQEKTSHLFAIQLSI